MSRGGIPFPEDLWGKPDRPEICWKTTGMRTGRGELSLMRPVALMKAKGSQKGEYCGISIPSYNYMKAWTIKEKGEKLE